MFKKLFNLKVIIRPNEAGLFYENLPYSFINKDTQLSFVKKSSKYLLYQTVRASNLKLCDSVHSRCVN